MIDKIDEEGENILLQCLKSLEVFEKTGDRRGFIACNDQIETYTKRRTNNEDSV